jgi:hypothetical protein
VHVVAIVRNPAAQKGQLVGIVFQDGDTQFTVSPFTAMILLWQNRRLPEIPCASP